jgi:hypothetical protein
VLATYIAYLTGDICATVLRMEETNHSDQIGRLKQDLEKYSALSLQLNSGQSVCSMAEQVDSTGF